MDRLVVLDGIAYKADVKISGSNSNPESDRIDLTFIGEIPARNGKSEFSVVEILEKEWRLQYRDAKVIHSSTDIEHDEPVKHKMELLSYEHEYI